VPDHLFLLASKMVAAEHRPVDLPWAVAARTVGPGDLGARVTITVRRVESRDEQAEYIVADWDGQQVIERLLQPGEIEALLATTRSARGAGQSETALRRARGPSGHVPARRGRIAGLRPGTDS